MKRCNAPGKWQVPKGGFVLCDECLKDEPDRTIFVEMDEADGLWLCDNPEEHKSK